MYKFALVGCGNISSRHVENINRVGKLTAVCDIIPEKADLLAAKFAAKPYYRIDDLLRIESDTEVIVVCTPNGLHAEHSIKSLHAGKHVLCEKPMCLTTPDALKMIEAEKSSNKILFVVISARFNPLLNQLKKAIEGNVLGKIYSVQLNCFWHRPVDYYKDWHGKIFSDGGTLYTQFSHYIDSLLWIIGEIKDLNGYRKNVAHKSSIEFEDTGVVCFDNINGIIGTINWSVNTYRKNAEIGLTILAEKATISLGGEYLNEVKYVLSDAFSLSPIINPLPNEYTNYRGSMSHHREIYNSVIETLQNPGNEVGNSTDGLKTVKTIEKIYSTVPLTDD